MQIHESIRNRVIDHLEACSGNAVIVFDEVQKVKPGALEVWNHFLIANEDVLCCKICVDVQLMHNKGFIIAVRVCCFSMLIVILSLPLL